MRANEFVVEKKNQQVDEILPALAAAAPILGRGALTGAQMLGRGAVAGTKAIGRAIPGAIRTAASVGGDVLSAAGDIVGGAARGIGNAVGGIRQGIRNASGSEQPQDNTASQAQSFKTGNMYNHPTLGPVKILPSSPGRVKLDTTQKLGFPITVDLNDLQRQS